MTRGITVWVCIKLRTYLPGPHKLSILPNTQVEYCQVEYWEKYSTFDTDFT